MRAWQTLLRALFLGTGKSTCFFWLRTYDASSLDYHEYSGKKQTWAVSSVNKNQRVGLLRFIIYVKGWLVLFQLDCDVFAYYLTAWKANPLLLVTKEWAVLLANTIQTLPVSQLYLYIVTGSFAHSSQSVLKENSGTGRWAKNLLIWAILGVILPLAIGIMTSTMKWKSRHNQ